MTGQHPLPSHATAPVSASVVGNYHVLVLPINRKLQRHGVQHISELMERVTICIRAGVVVVVAVVDGDGDAVTDVDAVQCQLPLQPCGGLFTTSTSTQNTFSCFVIQMVEIFVLNTCVMNGIKQLNRDSVFSQSSAMIQCTIYYIT